MATRRFAKKMRGRLSSRAYGNSPVNNGGWLYSSLRPNTSGVVIDEISALTITAIWRGVNVKAGDLAKLPINVYERLEKGGSHPDHSNRIYELLSYPNETRPGRRQRFVSAIHLILWGNAFQEIIRDPDTGDPERLELLDPRWVIPRRSNDKENRLTYWLKGSKSPWSGKTTLLPENVIHFSGLSLNGDSGLSTIQTNTESVGIASALDKFAGTVWGNGANFGGFIEVPEEWGDEARNNFRQMVMDEHGGVAQSNRIGILEEGAKFNANDRDLEKLQMLNSREFSVVEMARMLGLPTHKLFDMSHDVQRSLEEMNSDYYETEIEPIAQSMADEYSLKLLTVSERKRYYIGHDLTRLLKGTALQRAQTNEIKMRNGVISVNQWRSDEGDNPYEEDLRMVPLNMRIVKSGADLDPDPAGDDSDDPEPLPLPLASGSRKVLREALRRMTRREVLALQKAHERSTIDEPWLDRWYEDFSPILNEAVGPVIELHGQALGVTLDGAEVIRSLIDISKRELLAADDVSLKLAEWEASKVDQLVEIIEGMQ